MADVQSQIGMALQGLMASQRGMAPAEPPTDPRVLQAMLQMEQQRAMGIEKEQEKMQKEQLRQEKQATLGVLLQDALARQQQEEAFQRQMQFEQMRMDREKELSNQMHRLNMERLDFIAKGKVEENERSAEQLRKLQTEREALVADVMSDELKLKGDMGVIHATSSKAIETVVGASKRQAHLRATLVGDIETLNSTVLMADFEQKRNEGTTMIGRFGRDMENLTKQAFPGGSNAAGLFAKRESARQYGEGVAALIAKANPEIDARSGEGSEKRAEMARIIENLLLDSSSSELNADARLERYNRAVAELVELGGEQAPKVLKLALDSAAKGMTMAGQGADGTPVPPKFSVANSAHGRMFLAANQMANSELGLDPTGLDNPHDLMRGVFLSFTHLLYKNNPDTGQPFTQEERTGAARKFVQDTVDTLSKSLDLTSVEAADLHGYLNAAFDTLLPYDQKFLNYQLNIDRIRSRSETDASIQNLEMESMTLKRVMNQIETLIQENAAKKVKGESEATGTGEAAAGPGARAGTNAPKS